VASLGRWQSASNTALATALAETDIVTPEIAKPRGIALAGVFQIIITEAGRRTREGQSQNQIADELRPAIEAVLDDLDAWLTSATDQDSKNRATNAVRSRPYLTRAARTGNKPSRRLITEKSSPGQAAHDRNAPAFRTGNSALADNARDRPWGEGCTEHSGMRKQPLPRTNTISALNDRVRARRRRPG
jgi:hypothetical protein